MRIIPSFVFWLSLIISRRNCKKKKKTKQKGKEIFNLWNSDQWHVFFSFFFQVFISAADSCLVTPIYNWSRKKQHNWIEVSTELGGNNYTFQQWHSYSENQKQSLMTSSQSQKIGFFLHFLKKQLAFIHKLFP